MAAGRLVAALWRRGGPEQETQLYPGCSANSTSVSHSIPLKDSILRPGNHLFACRSDHEAKVRKRRLFSFSHRCSGTAAC